MPKARLQMATVLSVPGLISATTKNGDKTMKRATIPVYQLALSLHESTHGALAPTQGGAYGNLRFSKSMICNAGVIA